MRDERFEWGDEKAQTNLRDHSVTFAEATRAFDDDQAIDDIDESMDYDEVRWILTGLSRAKLLVVV